MNEEEAVVRFARTLGMGVGDVYFIQTEGQINNPHAHRRGDGSLMFLHTDGWAVRNDGLNYSIAKIHSDDFERGATPNWNTYYG
ncbi:MAG: hypothetical protein JWP19_2218 [Rhodoglobus sp.]|nr:hypothetical protein [Rhodoglobus sp.]